MKHAFSFVVLALAPCAIALAANAVRAELFSLYRTAGTDGTMPIVFENDR